ncbi:MAG: cadherin-like beta sandwich domain-containing protein, partial [Clostridia bacterium]|nr:cadherin-like beta sandwich domain-containing protein [Clostridia bacterium]
VILDNPVKINGNSVMPTYTNLTGTMTGNNGNGYARITVVSFDDEFAKLSSLDVENGLFNQAFNSDIYEYDVQVGADNYKVNITASTLFPEPKNVIFRGIGETTLLAGVNTHYVGVVSDTGNVSIYRLNIYRPPSSYPYLEDIKVDGVTIPGFSPSTLQYDITLPDTTEKVKLDATLGRPSQTVSGLGNVDINFGTTTHTIDVVSEDGNTITSYVINFKKSNTTKLKSLAPENYALSPSFNPDTYEYKITVPSAVLSLNVEAIPLDSGSTVKITGNGYLKTGVNNRITITVSQNGLPDSVYTIDVEREGIVPNPVFEFTCTKSVQEFEAPGSGYYKLEAWGAQGGYGHTHYKYKNRGGYGGYTSGTIWLNKGDTIYVAVGCQGGNAANTGRYNGGTGGYNGGSQGGNDKNHDSAPDAGGGGGGSTDFRLVGGTNTDFNSLKTRILVAGGGSGGRFGGIGIAGN